MVPLLLLRQGARRIGGSLIQRTQAAVTSPAVAEERRRLIVPRRMYSTEEGAGEGHVQQKKDLCARLREFRLGLKQFDDGFIKYLNGAFGLWAVYAIWYRDFLDEMDRAQTIKKK